MFQYAIVADYVVFIAVVLFIVLFSFQHCGTSKVSSSFSPIMVLWYATNVSIGIYNIITYHPPILKAISPHYIFKFFLKNGKTAWHLLGAVFLCITGTALVLQEVTNRHRHAHENMYVNIYYKYSYLILYIMGQELRPCLLIWVTSTREPFRFVLLNANLSIYI